LQNSIKRVLIANGVPAMKHFAIAFGIVCGVAAVLFGAIFALLSFIGIPQAQEVAKPLAGVVILAFPKVAEFLEQQESKKRLAVGRRKPVYDFRGFQIEWPLMVVYGTILLVVLLQAAGFFAGFTFAAAMRSIDDENVSKFAAFRGLQTAGIMIFASYFVGRWMGARISRWGILTMVLIAALAPTAAVGLDVAFLSEETYRKFAGSEPSAFLGILKQIAFTSFIIVVPGLVGYWRGRRQRLSKYLNYLLNVLPPQDRDTVVELAYGEAQKLAAADGGIRP
jgi:hypothetical protein